MALCSSLLVASRRFYLKNVADGQKSIQEQGVQRTCSWGRHGGPEKCWDFVKNVVAW